MSTEINEELKREAEEKLAGGANASVNYELVEDPSDPTQMIAKSWCEYEGVDNFEKAILLFVTHLNDISTRSGKDISEICMIAEQALSMEGIGRIVEE